MLLPLAPRNMSGAMWAAREENGVGVSSMWIDGQDLAARLEHQAQRSYCVWLKPHQSEAPWLELERRQAASTAALACHPCSQGLQGTAADDDDDEEFPVLALCCLKILQFELGSRIEYLYACLYIHGSSWVTPNLFIN